MAEAAKKRNSLRTRGTAGDRARNENSASDDVSFLSLYFREMAELDLLRPEEEFRCARRIEELETAAWQALLSCPQMCDWVLLEVEALASEEPLPSFRSLRTAATKARKRSSKANRASLERAARKLSELLVPYDRDRLIREEIVGKLLAYARGRSLTSSDRPALGAAELKTVTSAVERAEAAARRARNDFVRANLRLVVSIARRFNHGGMPLADLIQEGNIGLMKAVERYDYKKGFRFSTYASWWIRHAISRALADKGRQVRLPVHMLDAQQRLARAKRELTTKLGRAPNNEELANATNLSSEKIEKMRLYILDHPFSLDQPVNDDEGRKLLDVIEDPATAGDDAAERITSTRMSREVRSILHDLKPIEADILRRRFGLDDDDELTLKEIGKRYNLSRERIRQLQEQALAKVRTELERRALM